jgi:hypothetical protein
MIGSEYRSLTCYSQPIIWSLFILRTLNNF